MAAWMVVLTVVMMVVLLVVRKDEMAEKMVVLTVSSWVVEMADLLDRREVYRKGALMVDLLDLLKGTSWASNLAEQKGT